MSYKFHVAAQKDMFGQKHTQEHIFLDNLAEDFQSRQERVAIWNRSDTYRFRITDYRPDKPARFYRFVLPQPSFERNVNVFIQLDNETPAFKDVRLFKPLEVEQGGGYLSVNPYEEIQICGKDRGKKPVLENWILFFRNNCDSQVRENSFKVTLSHPADLFTVGVDVRVGTKLARGIEGTRLSNVAMDLLLKDEISLKEVESDLRTVLRTLAKEVMVKVPVANKFSCVEIDAIGSQLQDRAAQSQHDSISETEGENPGIDLIKTARARLQKTKEAIAESKKEILKARENLEVWKSAVLACRSSLEELFGNVSKNPLNYIDAHTNLHHWFEACDLFVVCDQEVRFGKLPLEGEERLDQLLTCANKQIQDLADRLEQTKDQVSNDRYGLQKDEAKQALLEKEKQADHRRAAEIQIIHEFGETLRVAAGTSHRAAEKVVDTASQLLEKISPPLPGTVPQQKLGEKSKSDNDTGKAIEEKSSSDYDSTAPE